MTSSDILLIVNSKLRNGDISEIDRTIAIEETGQVILNYCHIGEIPAALKFTWANMAVDLLNYEHAANTPADTGEADGDAQAAGAVSSIREGDTTVSFGGKSADDADRDRLLSAHQAKLDSLTLDYKRQLQGFRKVRW